MNEFQKAEEMFRNRLSGVYSITNLVNGKMYIGSTAGNKGFIGRWNGHKTSLNRGHGVNNHLQHAWNQYGEGNFKFDIVEIVENANAKILAEKETYWVNWFKSNDSEFGYNKRIVAESCLGIKYGPMSEEMKKKLSIAHMGQRPTEEMKRKISVAHKGRVKSPEWLKHLGDSHRGKKRGPLPEEVKRKISESNKGKIISDETRAKIGNAHRGKEISQKMREQIRNTIQKNETSLGENNPAAKITWEQAEEIRAKYIPWKCSCRDLAKEYGLSATTVHRILKYVIWGRKSNSSLEETE